MTRGLMLVILAMAVSYVTSRESEAKKEETVTVKEEKQGEIKKAEIRKVEVRLRRAYFSEGMLERARKWIREKRLVVRWLPAEQDLSRPYAPYLDVWKTPVEGSEETVEKIEAWIAGWEAGQNEFASRF